MKLLLLPEEVKYQYDVYHLEIEKFCSNNRIMLVYEKHYLKNCKYPFIYILKGQESLVKGIFND